MNDENYNRRTRNESRFSAAQLSIGLGGLTWRREMIVTLKGMPEGKDLAYETGFHYFVDHVRLRIAEHEPPCVTPSDGEKPVNFMPMEWEITFCFSHNVGGHSVYSAKRCK